MSIVPILLVPLPIIPRIIPWISAITSILRLLPHESIPPIWLPPIILALIAPLLPLLLIMRVITGPSGEILASHAELTLPIRSIFPPYHMIISLIFHSPLRSTNKGLYAYKIEEHKHQSNPIDHLIKNDNINQGNDL